MGNKTIKAPTHAAPVLPKKLEPLHIFLTNPRFFNLLAYQEANGYKRDFASYVSFILPLLKQTGVGYEYIFTCVPTMHYPHNLLHAYLKHNNGSIMVEIDTSVGPNFFGGDCSELYPRLLKIIEQKVTHTVAPSAFSDVEFTVGVEEPNLSKLAEKRTIPLDVVRVLSIIRNQYEHKPELHKRLVHMFVTCFLVEHLRGDEIFHLSCEHTELLYFLNDVTRNYKQYLPQTKEPNMYFKNNYEFTQTLDKFIKRRRDVFLRSWQTLDENYQPIKMSEEDQKVYDYVSSLPQDKNTRRPPACTIV